MATPTRLFSTIGGLRSLRGLAAVLQLLFALYACAPQEPIRIGFLGALSGRVTDLGISGLYGARLAVEQRNAADGIRGRAIELHIEDDRVPGHHRLGRRSHNDSRYPRRRAGVRP